MTRFFIHWLDCGRAATAVEYGLLAGGIACVCVAATILLGHDLRGVFEQAHSAFSGVASTIETN